MGMKGGVFLFKSQMSSSFFVNHCLAQAFSSCGEWGLLFIAVHGILMAVASLVVEHGLKANGLQQLWPTGLAVSHPVESSQISNPCLLHWQVDS